MPNIKGKIRRTLIGMPGNSNIAKKIKAEQTSLSRFSFRKKDNPVHPWGI